MRAWTMERSFRPFALGYVELPGQVIVETRIDVDDPSKLKIGMKMKAEEPRNLSERAASPFSPTSFVPQPEPQGNPE